MHVKLKDNKLKKVVLIIVGTFFLIIGLIGVVMPILPTAKFIFIASICYVSSSEKLYTKLSKSKVYQDTVGNMMEKKGMTLKTKLMILIPVWIMLGIMFFTVESTVLKILAIVLALGKGIGFSMIKTIK